MMLARRVDLVAVLSGVLVALCLAGCSSATPPAPTAALPPVPVAPASPSAPSTTVTSSDARPAGGQCRLDDLSARRGDGAYVAGMNQVRVIWTNRSDRTCTMNGFGGVDLLDAAGRRLSAARSSRPTSTVSLPPGGSAHTTISYPAAGGTGVFTPRTMVATPPNETHSAELAWGGGGVPTYESSGAGDSPTIDPVQPNVS